MRIIKTTRIRAYWIRHSRAKQSLAHWLVCTRAAHWSHFSDVRHTFPKTDQVTVNSGRTVIIFSIAGNHYRLITAIRYNIGKVFVLRFLTHSEYSQQDWKGDL